MTLIDGLRFAKGAAFGAPARTSLVLLAMSVGVAAVVGLTALGEGARRYVIGEFESLGTHLLVVIPGRSETTGGMPPLIGETARDLTIDDALSLYRLPEVALVAPLSVGEALVSHGSRSRDEIILGSSAELETIRHLVVTRGQFLPAGDPRRAPPVCVIGETVQSELFGTGPVLGQWLRVGDRRFRVIGVIEGQGQSIDLDLNEVVILPVVAAQAIFNTESLFRILVQARDASAMDPCRAAIERSIAARHQGELDVTVITQDAVLSAFDRILNALTMTLAGIAGISLVVAGILIMNVMLVSVAQRTAEIGLLKAIGASPGQIRLLILLEATLLSGLGALLGTVMGYASSVALTWYLPAFPAQPPWWAAPAASLVALSTGVGFAWVPARRASRLDPTTALSGR